MIIKPRQGTAAQWATSNRVLSAGEIGYETDTERSKRGNGSTAWNSLGYLDEVVAPDTTLVTPTLTDPKMSAVKGSNGNTVFQFFDLASAVNYLRVVNSVAGGFLTFSAQGADTDVSIGVVTKGAGAFYINGARAKTIVESAVTQPNTSYTLGGGDERTIREHTNASPVTITVPTNTTWAAPVGSVSTHVQYGAGQLTFAPADGSVTVNALGGATKSAGQHAVVHLRKRATNEWQMWGDITT